MSVNHQSASPRLRLRSLWVSLLLFSLLFWPQLDPALAQSSEPLELLSPPVAPIDPLDEAGASMPTTATSHAAPYAADQIIVKFAPERSKAERLQTAEQMTGLLQSRIADVADAKILQITPLFAAGTLEQATSLSPSTSPSQGETSALDQIYLATVVGDPVALVAKLQGDPAIAYAQLNYTRHIAGTPNDTHYPDLWGMAQIQAPSAWDTATGAGVVVAVIDTGVDLSHPDLQANLFLNPNEIAGNGIDDDNNGYADDVQGWDFVNNDNAPADGNGHGSHVAGTIAAVGNNNRGVVGLAYESTILPLRGLDNNGVGYDANLATAIRYAVDNGAKVINNSWGGQGRSPLYEDVINYAHAHGVVVVSAAGNDNQDTCLFTPANVENSLSVAAVGPTDAKASYSNFGVKVDVAAPGGSNANNTVSENILSTMPNGLFSTSAGYTGPDGESYKAIAGTSMAAPHVSALAALILQLHPTWSPEVVRQVIRQSSHDIALSGFDTESGYGRINAQQAVTFGAAAPPSAAIRSPHNCARVGGTIPVAGSAQPTTAVTYTVDIGVGELPTLFTPVAVGTSGVASGTLATLDTTAVPDGVATIRLRVYDANGLVSEDRNVVTVDNIQITAPEANALLAVAMTPNQPIYGDFPAQVAGTPFSEYRLDYAHSSTPNNYVSILTSNTLPPASGLLGNWNLAGVPDGAVTLRLTVRHGTLTSADSVNVVVDQMLKAGWPATVGHNGLFSGPSGNGIGYAFKSPMVADLDRDGHNEIVYGATVLQANGSLRNGWSATPGLGRTNPVILDLNQDGNLEVVAAVFTEWASSPSNSDPNHGAPVIYAYTHNKSVLWSYPLDNLSAGAGYDSGLPSSLSAGDVDGDGQMEILFSHWFNYGNSPSRTTIFVLNAATGAEEARFTVDGYGASSLALGDLDNDGIDEMVINTYISSSETGKVYVLNADGSLVAGWPQTMVDAQGAGYIDPVLGDVDRDGVVEILVGRNLWRSNGTDYPGWPVVNLSRSTSVFAQLDNDPNLEIILGAGNHVLYWAMDDTGAPISLNWKTDENLYEFLFGENGRQGAPILADLNGDGRPDLLRPSEMGRTDQGAGKLYGADPAVTGSSLTNFPRYLPSPQWGIIRSTAVVDDIDCDGNTDLFVAGGDQLYGWGLPGAFDRANNPWPTFQHDHLHTGNFERNIASVSACDLPVGGDVVVVDVWTDSDGGGTHATTFAQGAPIHYTALTENTTGSTQIVPGRWEAVGPCGAIFSQTLNGWHVGVDTLLWYNHETIPQNACPGQYTFTTSIEYQGNVSTKSRQFTVVATATGALKAPKRLLVGTLTEHELMLRWRDSSKNESGFHIERCEVTAGKSCTNFAPLTTVGIDVTTFTDSALTPNSPYCYRVQAYNSSGVSAYSNAACRTTAPEAPSNVTVYAPARGQAQVSWTDNATSEKGFKIERCQGSGCTNFRKVGAVRANQTAYLNKRLVANTVYCYRVQAYNNNGASSFSNSACLTTPAAQVDDSTMEVEEPGQIDDETSADQILRAWPLLTLMPNAEYPFDYTPICTDEAPATAVTATVGELSFTMQPNAESSIHYQTLLALQNQLAADDLYPLTVAWQCSNEDEPSEAFVGTIQVTATDESLLLPKAFLPLIHGINAGQ